MSRRRERERASKQTRVGGWVRGWWLQQHQTSTSTSSSSSSSTVATPRFELCWRGKRTWWKEGREKRAGADTVARVRGSRAKGVKSILCGLRPQEYTDEYTNKHEHHRLGS
ncbi:hypothetical protein M0802_001173 [Mischocyttarus mexicanus]|nr:hypothetical protein M0802_001173 [Mischocyttarus mexicanus]